MFEKIRRPGRSLKDGKVKKWFSYFIFGLICLVFVFLAPMGAQFIGKGVLGYVGGEPIRAREFRLVEGNIRRQYQSRLDQADEESYSKIQEEIRQKALRYLVEVSLLAQGAKKADFFLSDEELRAKIRSFPVFQQDGRFLYSRYLQLLKQEKLNPSHFEERIRKAKTAENWRALFKKSVFTNTLEQEKKSQRHRYKVNFRYVSLHAGDVEEQDLEPFVKARDVKKINNFLKKHKVKWEETGVFSLFSAFGQPIAQNQNLMEVLIHHLPSTGLIPRLIRQGDQIYVVHVLSFTEGTASPEERQLESFLEQNFDKSVRLLDVWMDFQREKIKVRLSDKI